MSNCVNDEPIQLVQLDGFKAKAPVGHPCLSCKDSTRCNGVGYDDGAGVAIAGCKAEFPKTYINCQFQPDLRIRQSGTCGDDCPNHPAYEA